MKPKIYWKFLLFHTFAIRQYEGRYWSSLAVIFLFVLSAIFQLRADSPANLERRVAGLQFSAEPTEAEIWNARVFDEPLIPIGGAPSPQETRALAEALTAYSSRTNLDDFSALTTFLDAFPESKWCGSLLLHLGAEYYNSGYYSRAMDSWEQAWADLKDLDDPKGKAQADRCAGELARMYSKLGRMDKLGAILEVATNRPLQGPATQLIHSAQLALWMMQKRPEVCFRCGPLALDEILTAEEAKRAGNPLIFQSRSTTNGFSLSQVAELSTKIGMNYQMAYRSSGAPFIVPSVIHWSVGHYAALLAKSGNRFLVKDHTFQSSLLMTANALNDEASGYFLVPSGALPRGWRIVSEPEGNMVYGRGNVSSQDPNQTGPTAIHSGGNSGGGGQNPNDPGNGNNPTAGDPSGNGDPNASPPDDYCPLGMTTYTINTMLASLSLNDTPVGYKPPVGPWVKFTATYNQNNANQATTFYYSNLGPDWTCNWISYIIDNPNSAGVGVMCYAPGGGTLTFSGYSSTTKTFAPELTTQAILRMTSSSSYELQFRSGAKKEYTLSDGSTGTTRRIFLTQVIDPAGNAVQLKYDSSLRITNIVDAIGQPTTLAYTNTAYPYAITEVTDPFGRSAAFQYNAHGLLAKITDVLELSSEYSYGSNDFVSTLVTPYGTTSFNSGTTNGVTWLQATDPLGESELVEAIPNSANFVGSEPSAAVPLGISTYNTAMNYRDSFFWDKKAFQDAAGILTNATVYHFLHASDGTVESGVLESVQKPLENMVWYYYPGQSASWMLGPQSTARPSSVARVLDDGTTQIRQYKYNLLGCVTNTTDPAGRNFTYVYSTNNADLLAIEMTSAGKNELQSKMTYNSQHKPLTITDASGQTTTNTYNMRGQILTTTDPLHEMTTFSYDTNGYLLSITGPLQNTNDIISFTYDAFGRVQTTTNTDGYTLLYAYDAMDRVTNITYPDSTTEQFIYSNLDLVASADRLGRWTTRTYNADRQLIQKQDPLGRVSHYEWCHCGAMTGLIDPMGRKTTWEYDLQSRPIAKTYADGSTISYVYENTTSRLSYKVDEQGQETIYRYYIDDALASVNYPNAINPTPPVIYTFDPNYNRMVSMQDGIGQTIYSYYPISQMLTTGADRLASVSGPLQNSLVTYQYDQLGRVTNRSIAGVSEAVSFDVLGRAVIITNALGIFTNAYIGATARLASQSYPNSQSNYYAYYNNLSDNRLEEILHQTNGMPLSELTYGYNSAGQITSMSDSIEAAQETFQYDAADELTNVVSVINGGSLVAFFGYTYDHMGNRLTATGPCLECSNTYSYNALNQLTAGSGEVTDATYKWDGEHRLIEIDEGTNQSEFSYDGMGRRVRITELTNGTVQADNYYMWSGPKICQMRDSTGAAVLRRLFDQGESLVGTIGNTNYYYTRDQIGSIREAVNANGGLVTRYNYDPYGQKSILEEGFQTTFGFTGNFVHQKSGLYLTWFRALDSSTGRWISRDPLGEIMNINLYVYVRNDPVNGVDPYGLCDNNNGNQNNNYASESAVGAGENVYTSLAAAAIEEGVPGVGAVATAMDANQLENNYQNFVIQTLNSSQQQLQSQFGQTSGQINSYSSTSQTTTTQQNRVTTTTTRTQSTYSYGTSSWNSSQSGL